VSRVGFHRWNCARSGRTDTGCLTTPARRGPPFQGGKQFDPELVKVFLEIYEVVRAIREKWS